MILLANLVKLLRILVLAIAVMPSILPALLPSLLAGIVVTLPIAWVTWPRHTEGEALENPELTNPTDLPVALGFGAAYAAVLLAAAWLNDLAGAMGVYAVAMVSGLTDVDAISLSSFRLFGNGSVTAASAVMAIVVATVTNAVTKAGIVFVVGGRSLGMRCVWGFAAMSAAMLAAAFALPG